MDDLALTRLRSDAPLPAPSRLAAGRWKLMAEAAREAAGPAAGAGRDRLPRHAARRAALAGLTAAAVTAGVLVASGGHSGGAPASRTGDVGYVLDRAAAHAERASGKQPGPHQWIYTDEFRCYGQQCRHYPSWVRYDGNGDARMSLDHGKRRLSVSMTNNGAGPADGPVFPGLQPGQTYERLAALPTEPHALLKALTGARSAFVGSGGALPDQLGKDRTRKPPYVTPAQLQFGRIASLLETTPLVAPKVDAALYRALKLVPGVRVSDRPAHDAAGRSAIAVEMPLPAWHTTSSVLLDGKTYRYLGTRLGPYDEIPAVGVALVASAVVDRPGQFPASAPDPFPGGR